MGDGSRLSADVEQLRRDFARPTVPAQQPSGLLDARRDDRGRVALGEVSGRQRGATVERAEG